MSKTRCNLWARSQDEPKPTLREQGNEDRLLFEAQRLASASGDEGVMSVWVATSWGDILWSAGEKATELQTAPPGANP